MKSTRLQKSNLSKKSKVSKRGRKPLPTTEKKITFGVGLKPDEMVKFDQLRSSLDLDRSRMGRKAILDLIARMEFQAGETKEGGAPQKKSK